MKEILDFNGISLEQLLSNGNKNDCDCIEDMPLAMAFVPVQKFNKTYEPDSALCFGTIFPELNKPFCRANMRGDMNAK